MTNGAISPEIVVNPGTDVDTQEIVQFDGSNSTAPDSSNVQFIWAIAEEENAQTPDDYTVREGNQVLHSWSEAGQYEVSLSISVDPSAYEDHHPISNLWETQDKVSVQITVSEDGGSDLGDLTDEPESDKQWGGAVGEAEDKHNEYVQKLNDFQTFREGKEDKIRLWDMVFKTLDHAKNNPSADTGDHFEKVGLTAEAFSSDYDWEPNDPWGRLLGFGDRAIDDIKKEGLKSTNDNVKKDVAFISFGRQLIAERAPLEAASKDLIYFLKYGDEYTGGSVEGKPDTSHERLPDHVNETLTGGFDLSTGKPIEPLVIRGNSFMAELAAKPYIEQISILREVTARLHETAYGKRYLAELWAYREEPGIIDPYSVLQPPERTLEEKLKRGQPYLAINADEHSIGDYFDEQTGALRLSSGSSSEDAGMLVELLPELLTELCYGVVHMLKEHRQFATSESQAQEMVAKFTGQVLSLYVSQQAVDAAFRPEFGSEWDELADKAVSMDDTTWGWKEHTTIGKILAGSFDKTLKKIEILQTAMDERPKPVAKFKTALIVLSLSSTIYAEFTKPDKNQDWSDTIKTTGVLVKAIGDTYDVGQEFPKLVEMLPNGLTDSQKVTRVLNVLTKKVNPVIDIVFVLMDAWKMKTYGSREDYDAIGAVAIQIAGSGVLFSSQALAGWTAGVTGLSFGTAFIAVVILGAAIVITGLIHEWEWADSRIETWLKHTVFGNTWESSDADYDSPTHAEFLFKLPSGEPNLDRQISEYFSTIRPLNMESTTGNYINTLSVKGVLDQAGDDPPAHVGVQYFQGTSEPALYTLGIDIVPPTTQDSNVGIRKDGVLYLRPGVRDGGDPSFGPILHKISLDDRHENRQENPHSDGFSGDPNKWDSKIPFTNIAFPPQQIPPRDQAMEIAEVIHSRLNAMYDQADVGPGHVLGPLDIKNYILPPFPIVSLRPEGSTRYVDEFIDRLTVQLHTPHLPALLGLKPVTEEQVGWNNFGDKKWKLKWPEKLYLEAVYVPPMFHERIEERSANPYRVMERDIEVFSLEQVTSEIVEIEPPKVFGDPDWLPEP